MLLLLFVVQVHPIVILEGDFRLNLYNDRSNYTIHITDGGNITRYSYPVETDVDLKYDGNFTLNNHPVYITYQNGTVTPPRIIQVMFKEQAIYSKESLQVCYDFTKERTSLKVTVAVLVVLFLLSHGPKSWALIQTISSDLLQSELTRRFSRSRSVVPGSEENITDSNKTTSC